ncbi:MAG: TonB-dependent receptor, partial [Bacteroidota bacterium]|nr:TonB-dependent receptor [Bacteroidota bacterium]
MFLLFCVLVLTLSIYAQTMRVQGKITDDHGAIVPAATISTKNSKKVLGITRNDGTFSVNVPLNETLVISAVGFQTQELTAQPNLDVTLKTDVNTLTDVVVTGVGVATSKRKVAIDVATVSSKNFAKSATTSIEQALDGQIAGAQITQTSGQPGAAFNIILRGVNSLGSTQPLILIDGVETRDLTSLDPANVDHIEVVKGAA